MRRGWVPRKLLRSPLSQCAHTTRWQNQCTHTHTHADLFPCQRHTPCQDGATCTNNGYGGYRCTCVAGYTGTNCQTNINDCSPNPCHNGGTCIVSAGGKTTLTSPHKNWISTFCLWPPSLSTCTPHTTPLTTHTPPLSTSTPGWCQLLHMHMCCWLHWDTLSDQH